MIYRASSRAVELAAWIFAACVALGAPARAQGAHARPNVVVIMADDMGYSDIGCYGGEIQTPQLDELARGGVRMTQFYNTSRCCPTRAALMTGLYSHQAGIGLMTSDRGHDAYRGDLNFRCVTMAEALQLRGYRCYMSGKWHLTRFVRPGDAKHSWPRQRGFDRFYGTITGAGSFFDPATLCRGNRFITPENDEEYRPERFYYTDAISDNAVRYIEEHARDRETSGQPFFLYVAYTTAHWPMHALEGEIEKYEGAYADGFEAIRERRFTRAKALGVLDERWAMSALPRAWEKTPHKAWELRSMEVCAAMIDRMDQGIGKIVDVLRREGKLDNTLLVYLQDNGACAEGYGRRSNAKKIAASKGRYKALGRDGLQTRIWPPMQTRDGRAVRTGPGVMAGPEDSFIAYGRGWANVSNTPFRGYKHDAYEGGISTPCIVHWPKGLKPARANSVVDAPSHLIDLMPTVLDAAGAHYPERYGDRDLHALEGVSLLPALRGDALVRERPLGFEHHGNCALRDGRWKIVSQYRKKDSTRRWELYDMLADRTELHDLASEKPERTSRMVDAWRVWAKRVGVQPWPFPRRGK